MRMSENLFRCETDRSIHPQEYCDGKEGDESCFGLSIMCQGISQTFNYSSIKLYICLTFGGACFH